MKAEYNRKLIVEFIEQASEKLYDRFDQGEFNFTLSEKQKIHWRNKFLVASLVCSHLQKQQNRKQLFRLTTIRNLYKKLSEQNSETIIIEKSTLSLVSNLAFNKSFEEWKNDPESDKRKSGVNSKQLPGYLLGTYEGWFLRTKQHVNNDPWHIAAIYLRITNTDIEFITTNYRLKTTDWIYCPGKNDVKSLLSISFKMEPEFHKRKLPFLFSLIINQEKKIIYLEGEYSGYYPTDTAGYPISGSIILAKREKEEINVIFNDQTCSKLEETLDCQGFSKVEEFAKNEDHAFNFLRENSYSGNAAFIGLPKLETFNKAVGCYNIFLVSTNGNSIRCLPLRISTLGIAFIKAFDNNIFEGKVAVDENLNVFISTYSKYKSDRNSIVEKFRNDLFFNYLFNISTEKSDPICFFEGFRSGIEQSSSKEFSTCRILIKKEDDDYFDKSSTEAKDFYMHPYIVSDREIKIDEQLISQINEVTQEQIRKYFKGNFDNILLVEQNSKYLANDKLLKKSKGKVINHTNFLIAAYFSQLKNSNLPNKNTMELLLQSFIHDLDSESLREIKEYFQRKKMPIQFFDRIKKNQKYKGKFVFS